MKETRMLAAAPAAGSKTGGWLYTLMAVFLVVFFLQVGSMIGNLLIWSLIMAAPPSFLQWLMFTIDPIFMNLLTFLFPAVIIILWVKAVEKRSVVGLGFFKKKAWSELLKGFLIGFILIGAVVGLQWLSGSIYLTQLSFSSANIVSFLLILPFWLIQSGTEELLTRGWLFPVVTKKTNIWIGTGTSSLLFAVLHLLNPSVNWISLLNIALFGLLACIYLLLTDSIWGISAMHASWNFFQGSFFGLNVSGLSTAYAPMRFENSGLPDYMSGGGFGPEGSLFASLVLLLAILVLFWQLRKKGQEKGDD